MDAHPWLRRTALQFPLLAGALVLVLFATHPDSRDCSGSGLTAGDHAYLTTLRGAGGAAALATVAVIWLLARRYRSLSQTSDPWWRAGIDAGMILSACVILLGVTVALPLLAPFLILGYLSVVFPVAPIAAAFVYVTVARSRLEQQFIKRALIFYSLTLALLIPGVFSLLALRVSPVCLN